MLLTRKKIKYTNNSTLNLPGILNMKALNIKIKDNKTGKRANWQVNMPKKLENSNIHNRILNT